MEYIKSPLNYTGGKFKLLPQLLELFPKDVNTFVDLFGGGGNVAVNVEAKHIIYNDIMWQVPEMLEEFKRSGVANCLERIDGYIDYYRLTKEDQENFLHFRDLYNEVLEKEPIMLYTLICYSFNHQLRFNNNMEFNSSFGKNRSSFNPALREKFIAFVTRLQEIDIEFYSKDFREVKVGGLQKGDFIYCDPPYSITCATYNDGKRGFKGWAVEDDLDLFKLLDKVDSRGVKFALSNIMESKGAFNHPLAEWAKRYHIHYLNSNYTNCSYRREDKKSKDIEVLITNY